MPSNNWYQGRKIADIANMALRNVNTVLGKAQYGNSPADIVASDKSLRSAVWWLFEYKNGQAHDEISNLCQSHLSDPDWAKKDDYNHQRIAKIAGFWVPGRPKGSKNKPKQGTATVTEHTVPMPSPASITPMQMASAVPTPAADAPQDFDPAKLSTMIDTSSMSMSVVWGSVVTLLMAAERNDRPEEDKVILRDTISVLKELI
jgi:hypothetical protein